MAVTINGTTGVNTPGEVLGSTTLLSAGTGTITFPAATGTVLLSGGSTLALAGTTSGTLTLSAPAVAGTNTATFPAKTGNVMIDGPAFRGTNSGVVSITPSTATKVLVTNDASFPNNGFSSSRFTPTVTGYYQINGSVYIGGGSMTSATVYLYKNGALYDYISVALTPAGTLVYYQPQLSTIVYLNGSTDYVELYCSGNGTTAGYNAVSFNGCLIRGA